MDKSAISIFKILNEPRHKYVYSYLNFTPANFHPKNDNLRELTKKLSCPWKFVSNIELPS